MTETSLHIDRQFMLELRRSLNLIGRLRLVKTGRKMKKQYGDGFQYFSVLDSNGIYVPQDNQDQDIFYAYDEIEQLVESKRAYAFVTKSREFIFVGKKGLNESAFKTYIKRLFDAHILACKSLPASF